MIYQIVNIIMNYFFNGFLMTQNGDDVLAIFFAAGAAERVA